MSDRPLHPDRERIKSDVLDEIVKCLIEVEADFDREISNAMEGFDRGAAERKAAGRSLARIVEKLRSMDVPSRPLEKLLAALLQVEAQGKPAAMFKKARPPHRAPDAPTLQILKATVAAVVDFRMKLDGGLTLSDCCKWANSVIAAMNRPTTFRCSQRAIREWRDRFNDPNDHGEGATTYRKLLLYFEINPNEVAFSRAGLEDAIRQAVNALPEIPPS